jgi:hypothetical protein
MRFSQGIGNRTKMIVCDTGSVEEPFVDARTAAATSRSASETCMASGRATRDVWCSRSCSIDMSEGKSDGLGAVNTTSHALQPHPASLSHDWAPNGKAGSDEGM